MKDLYESKFMKLCFDEQKLLIEETWDLASEEMTKDEFKDEILTTLKYMQILNPKFYFVNSEKLKFAITPEIQEWMHQNFIIPFVEIGVEKAAFVISKDMITEVSVEQTTDEDTENKFQRQFFDNRASALQWLTE